MLKWIRRVLIAIVLLIAIVFGGAYLYLRRSLPQMDGTVTVSGISGPVDIIRDADSITHVFGATKLDTYFGLGYAHAQDRLWQMEFQRRVGMGRLSEVIGIATLNTDRFLRTLGTNRAARSAWESLEPESKRALNAYVAGVNAFISTHHGGTLPLEFTLLRFEPEPWTGPDVLAWVKMMAWDLSKNYTLETLRVRAEQHVGKDRAADLFPPYPGDGLRILSKDPPFLQSSAVESLPLGNALGSNNWVVDGTMTASGKPLLANDPHLDAQIPSLWYLAHLSAGDFDVIGATLPGAPAIVIGRNKYIAWGETNVMADVQDLYREPRDEAMQTLTEKIVIKGSNTLDWPVRISRHGPIMSDAISANEGAVDPQAPRSDIPEPIAFRWTALDPVDPTVTAILKVNEAHNWREFTAALRDFTVPAQNFVYADVDGHIGYYAPGHYPIRRNGEWTGWIPFDELPHVFDPPDHFIVTANNKVTSDPRIEGEWIDAYRATRIIERLKQKPKLTSDDFASIQADSYSLHAKALVPLLLQRVHPIDAADGRAVEIIKQWKFDAGGDSAAEAIFQAWFLDLSIDLVADKLHSQTTSDYLVLDKTSYRARFVMNTIATNDNAWCDNVGTAAKESCDDTVSKALHDAVARLTKQLGTGMSAWRWDAAHHAVFAHPILNGFPVLGTWLRREVPHGGDWSTVNVGPVYSPKPFEDHSIPGYRQIVDLSSANDSRFLEAVGQSGHVLSPHYDDALPLWQAVKHRKMRMNRADVDAGAIGHLRLAPR
jgi:penicillin amidase